MKRILCIALQALLITGASIAAEPEVRIEADKPNFVIILADDLGYGDVSCYGSEIETPNIDQLAKEGLKFTDFHSNGPVCSATRCSLMTGRYQHRAGIAALVRGDKGLNPDELTLAEVLKSSGYAAAIFGKWHLGELPKFNPTRQGFDVFKGHLTGRIDYFTHHAAGGDQHLDWWNGLEPLEEEGYSTTLIAEHSIDFIRRSRSEPFFLYVAFNAPHTPIHYPETGEKSKTPEAYGKVVQSMDSAIGHIISAIKDNGLEKNTLVFFFSDNGAPQVSGASNGLLSGYKGTGWEGGHRVPAIAWWPGRIATEKTTDQTAMGMDLMPTCVELAGAKLPPEHKLDGVSLVSLLCDDRPLAPRKLFWNKGAFSVVRDGPWKLLIDHGNANLFDLSNDLSEKINLATQQPERVETMKAEIEHWAKEVGIK